ncbi:MAG: DUF99 family protein [Thermoplasmata archaeon]|nr:MAG: DUF99 family protein [Thermoplasmata archaeon]
MKPQVRVLGIDDAPFKFGDKKTTVIGVVTRIPSYIEAVLKTEVEVDGSDACDKLEAMINSSRYKEQLKLVMLDGVALGGFNVIDIDELHKKIGLPVITITREEPNFEAMEKALKEHFEDWQKRLDIIKKGELFKIKTAHKPIFVKFTGMDLEDVKRIIDQSTIRGALPEPIRVAHLIASGVVSGESYGRA